MFVSIPVLSRVLIAKYRMAHYKSALEKAFAAKHALPYETDKLLYVQARTYTPDFKLGEHHYVECKGRFTGAERTKTLLALKQHPELKLVFVFNNPETPLNKGSKTTYRDWCSKNNIQCFKIGDPALAAYIAEYKA
ncbi:hypothetical protein WG922_13530 [Ramlibacter sp. AN1015]|uniref:hypothetical protein n=1 Tax=Ramlibacter sp. AN1015 TaxID=3133428 RepID=UPI0030C6169D